MNYKYTAEDLLSLPETFDMMLNLADKNISHICSHIRDFHAKTKNYKDNVYYHVVSLEHGDEHLGYSGVGEGLYIGMDKNVLIYFYGLDFTEGERTLKTYYGNPNFLDLVEYNLFKEFHNIAKEKYPNEVNNNELKKLTLELEYDGIRYYDPLATGEEFVLYNINKVKLIETINV